MQQRTRAEKTESDLPPMPEDETRQRAHDLGRVPVVPPKVHRLVTWSYNRALYAKRNVNKVRRRMGGFRVVDEGAS